MSAIISITTAVDRKIADLEASRSHLRECARRYTGRLKAWAELELEAANVRWADLMDRRCRMAIREVASRG